MPHRSRPARLPSRVLGKLEVVGTDPVECAVKHACVPEDQLYAGPAAGQPTQCPPQVQAPPYLALTAGHLAPRAETGDPEHARRRDEYLPMATLRKEQPSVTKIEQLPQHTPSPLDQDPDGMADDGPEPVDEPQQASLPAGPVGDLTSQLRCVCLQQLRLQVVEQLLPAHAGNLPDCRPVRNLT